MDYYEGKIECGSNEMKSQERIKQNGEVFTPSFLVQEILDKLPPDCWQEEKTFLDPACGDGNFLVAILMRKLRLKHNPKNALSTLYGVDIMLDNIRQCRMRLLRTLYERGIEVTKEHRDVVNRNIQCQNALDYDFSFKGAMK
jgi:type I restriction-modification system DNA methylase subunit